MKSENILQAINDIDPELVADAESTRKSSPKRIIFRWAAVAACLLLIAGLVWEALAPPKIPVYENAMYTAEDIGNMMNRGTLGTPTSSYEEVYVPSAEYLKISPVPDDEYLPIYQCITPQHDLNKEEFKVFLESRIPKIANKLGIDIPIFEIEQNKNSYSTPILHIDRYRISAFQNSLRYFIEIGTSTHSVPDAEIIFDGKPVQIGLHQSDEEIIDSLASVKASLFQIFGASYSDIKVVRSYEDTGLSSANWITVYFYNKSECPLNITVDSIYSDYIALEFNDPNTPDNTVMWCVSAIYCDYRSEVNEMYPLAKQAKRISLQDAEAFLHHGYVFGGHSCSICMQAQTGVDFTNYDRVGLSYISGSPHNNITELIPFYTFYKIIGVAENGNEIYARTYVPAIEVSGYEEYFKSQEAKHPSK